RRRPAGCRRHLDDRLAAHGYRSLGAPGLARRRGCRGPGLRAGASSYRHPAVTRPCPAPRYTRDGGRPLRGPSVIRRLFTRMAGGRRARLRAAAAATAELDRKQAMFRDELEQRLQVQRQLRESDARVRAIVDSAPIVLFAIDRDGAITFSAGVGPDPLGKKPGEAIGWSAADLFVDHPVVVDGIRNALSGIGGRADLIQGERSFAFN